jgi:hypothetical protein
MALKYGLKEEKKNRYLGPVFGPNSRRRGGRPSDAATAAKAFETESTTSRRTCQAFGLGRSESSFGPRRKRGRDPTTSTPETAQPRTTAKADPQNRSKSRPTPWTTKRNESQTRAPRRRRALDTEQPVRNKAHPRIQHTALHIRELSQTRQGQEKMSNLAVYGRRRKKKKRMKS